MVAEPSSAAVGSVMVMTWSSLPSSVPSSPTMKSSTISVPVPLLEVPLKVTSRLERPMPNSSLGSTPKSRSSVGKSNPAPSSRAICTVTSLAGMGAILSASMVEPMVSGTECGEGVDQPRVRSSSVTARDRVSEAAAPQPAGRPVTVPMAKVTVSLSESLSSVAVRVRAAVVALAGMVRVVVVSSQVAGEVAAMERASASRPVRVRGTVTVASTALERVKVRVVFCVPSAAPSVTALVPRAKEMVLSLAGMVMVWMSPPEAKL